MLLAVLAVPSAAQQAEDTPLEAVLAEVDERIEQVMEWVMDRLAEFEESREQPREEPRPLGKTVRLQFALEGTEHTFTVVTATTHFHVGGNTSKFGVEPGTSHQMQEVTLNADGRIALAADGNSLLLHSEGSFMVIRNFEGEEGEQALETMLNFGASTQLSAGEKRTLASHNGIELTVTATFEPEG